MRQLHRLSFPGEVFVVIVACIKKDGSEAVQSHTPGIRNVETWQVGDQESQAWQLFARNSRYHTPTNPLGVWSHRSKGNLENSFCPIQKSPSFRHAQPVAYPRGKPATWPRLALFCCFIYHLCEDCLISASRPPLQ